MLGRRIDNRMSDATTMTGTGTTSCSTCQTTDRETVVSYDPSGIGEENENRTTYRSSVDSAQATKARSSAASSGPSRDSTLTEESEVTTSNAEDDDDDSQCSTCVTAPSAVSNRTPEKKPSPVLPDGKVHRGKYYSRATSISSDSTPPASGRIIGSDSVIEEENTREYSQESPSLAASMRQFEQRVSSSPRRLDNNASASNRATGGGSGQKRIGILTASQDSLLTSSTSSYVASPVPPLPPPPSYHSFSNLNFMSTPTSAPSGGRKTVNSGSNWKSPSALPNLSSFSRSSNYYDYRDESDDKPLPLETAM